MDKKNQKTKLVKSLEGLGALFIAIAILIFIVRIIFDVIYGGSHLVKTNDIFLFLGFFIAFLAYCLQKRIAGAIFFGFLTISQLLSLFGM